MKIKKLAARLMLLSALTVSFLGQDAIFASSMPAARSTSSEGIAPCAEQTMWFTREVNGKKQKRLWSVTYGKWLTDWIDM